ncbi:sialidase family protein [Streptomyces flavofungini]|uniref:sialidase family protein n=1 Tax=Streptomyces flavofungini TaxID=68200 RepID=UPI0025B0B3BD|nr:sialidase family protein [Streptomyces flavofungini]WJV46569.1 sialidase family protein [Streptomyces flavofungini]
MGVWVLVACGAGAEGGGSGGARASGGRGAEKAGGRGAEKAAGGRAPVQRIPSAPDLPGSPFGIGFAADGSGFALLVECAERRCRQHVAVLEGGAKAWRRGSSPLRDVTSGRGVSADLTVLGPGRALIGEGSERVDAPGRTWFTGDGGRTWRRGTAGAAAAGPAAAVARGGVLFPECLERDRSDPNDCVRERLLALSPRTGRHHVLVHQPPLKGPLRQAGDLSGAGLFVSGTDPRTGLPALARSTDRGRTWQRPRLPGVGAEGAVFRVVGGRGGLYATQHGPVSPPAKNGLVTMHVSKDGGLTWTRVWRHRKGVEPRTLIGDVLVADDSSVTLHGEDGGWRSTDGARTFVRVTARTPSGSVVATPVGWLRRDSFGGNEFRISADGVHWRGFRLGRGD